MSSEIFTLKDFKSFVSKLPGDFPIVFRCAALPDKWLYFNRWKWRGENLLTIELDPISDVSQIVEALPISASPTVADILAMDHPPETEIQFNVWEAPEHYERRPLRATLCAVIDLEA